jgi:nucleoside-diphosphate-sugar epimerase
MRDLVDHGYDVLNVDVQRTSALVGRFLRADITDFGQTVEALRDAEAVVHLAAIPAPGLQTDEVTFRTNMTSTFNVFQAAALLKLERVVWASSETTLGLPFDRVKPVYAPIDEDHPLNPESTYALSKVLSEEMARQVSRWSGMPIVGLRFSNVMEPGDYAAFPGFQEDPFLRKWNLWGYVDARDVAQSCRLGLEAGIQGAEAFIIAAADTVMRQANQELMARVFPGVPLRAEGHGTATLLSIEKARRVLGYAPAWSWRTQV